ncbi:hypothetical protein E4U60_000221, partial [Claviceps pazoutovae]
MSFFLQKRLRRQSNTQSQANYIPQPIRRFEKEISSGWKSGYADPDLASPQDATDWMANRIRAYTDKAPTLERFREDFKDWSLRLFTEANAGVRLCLRDLLQKKGIETKKGSGDSVPKILFEIVKFGKADPIVPSSPVPVLQALPTRPTTPSHPVNETQPIQIMQQTLQQLMQQQTETQQMQQAAMQQMLQQMQQQMQQMQQQQQQMQQMMQQMTKLTVKQPTPRVPTPTRPTQESNKNPTGT